MCLGIPGKIIKKWKHAHSNIPMAQVTFGGIKKDICLMFNPEAKINEYVMVHVGFAISIIDEEIARQTLQFIKTEGKFAEELNLNTK